MARNCRLPRRITSHVHGFKRLGLHYRWSAFASFVEALPHLRKDLDGVWERLWILHPVINAHYYHPAFGGSYPIKAVLSAMAPYVADDDLAIKGGMMPSLQFHRMAFGGGGSAEKATIRRALLRYCERDTLAMVELRKTLRGKART